MSQYLRCQDFKHCLARGVGGMNDASMAVTTLLGQMVVAKNLARAVVARAAEFHALIHQPLDTFPGPANGIFDDVAVTEPGTGDQGVFDMRKLAVIVVEHGGDAALGIVSGAQLQRAFRQDRYLGVVRQFQGQRQARGTAADDEHVTAQRIGISCHCRIIKFEVGFGFYLVGYNRKHTKQHDRMEKSHPAMPATNAGVGPLARAGSKDTDEQLVERVFKGEMQAFDLLVLRYQHRLLGLIGRLVRDPHEAEDIAQETFIKAYRALSNFRGESAFYTWLYRIAINTANNYLVSRGRRPPDTDVDIDDDEEIEAQVALADTDDPEASRRTEELKQAIDKAIAELPEDLRTAFSLREFSGLSYEEITEIMGCPVGTVRSRIFRAREAIDNKIKPLLEPD